MADLEKLDKAISELEVQSTALADYNRVYAEMARLQSDVAENLTVLRENNAGFEELTAQINAELSSIKKSIDEIYADNKAFQKELDQSLASRLDKHKSDLEVSIRNEGAQIQRGFETALKGEFQTMRAALDKSFQNQSEKVNGLKTLSIILIIINVILAAGLGYLLFK